MLAVYTFLLPNFLHLSYVVAVYATCCSDIMENKLNRTDLGIRNRYQHQTTTTNVVNSTSNTSLIQLYDAVPLTQNTRINTEVDEGRSESEARWFFSWWLVPYYGPYYEFYVNEYSYKFWAVFQLVTVAILLYSAFAAIYFAKYTFLTQVDNIKEDDLLFWWRSFQSREFQGLDPSTYQRIMDAIHPT